MDEAQVRMNVLIACEFSGVVREAFRHRGHNAWSCDLLPTETKGPYFQMDILRLLERSQTAWDLVVAHPPCTYLANSGVQHLWKDQNRWKLVRYARDFFMSFIDLNISMVAVENPILHGYAKLPPYTQIIKPNWFGENKMGKTTCLWLKGLPSLKPTNVVEVTERYFCHSKSNGSLWYQRLSPCKDRWKARSRTPQGVAEAMAEQWGSGNRV